jgi:hypothetical protein
MTSKAMMARGAPMARIADRIELSDPCPDGLPQIPWLPENLARKVREWCGRAEGERGGFDPLPESIEVMVRETARDWATMMATAPSRERLAAWYALVQGGTAGAPRTGNDLVGFLEAAHFAFANTPAAAFCKTTQRDALLALRFTPSVADLMGVLKPRVDGLKAIQEAFRKMLRATDEQRHLDNERAKTLAEWARIRASGRAPGAPS